MANACAHVREMRVTHTDKQVCEDCLRIGSRWVHLRLCLSCGHVGCCDSSPNRHATKHFHQTTHPLVRSIEPGESWGTSEQVPARRAGNCLAGQLGGRRCGMVGSMPKTLNDAGRPNKPGPKG